MEASGAEAPSGQTVHRPLAGEGGMQMRGGDEGGGGLQFPGAAQPDILRSSMKDDFYRKMLYSSTLDLVLRSLGAAALLHPFY